MSPKDRKEEVQLQGALWGSHGGSGICQDLLSKGSGRRLALLKVGGWCLSPLAEVAPVRLCLDTGERPQAEAAQGVLGLKLGRCQPERSLSISGTSPAAGIGCGSGLCPRFPRDICPRAGPAPGRGGVSVILAGKRLQDSRRGKRVTS